MIRADVCYLIKETPGTHGVFDTPQRTERMVYCTVRSVSSADYWRAYEHGVTEEYVFVLSDSAEYQGETLIRYGEGDAARYFRVVRTYVNGPAVEITVEEAKAYESGNAESGA